MRCAWRALWRNTDERAAAREESETAVLIAREPDARTDQDCGRGARGALEREPPRSAYIRARELAADAQCRAHAPRPAREVAVARRRPEAAHQVDALRGLEGADEHRGADAHGL